MAHISTALSLFYNQVPDFILLTCPQPVLLCAVTLKEIKRSCIYKVLHTSLPVCPRKELIHCFCREEMTAFTTNR